MDMDAPLISRGFLLLVWAAAGIAAALFLTFAKMVRGDPPLTTQTDQVTGMKHHGLWLWAVFFQAILVGPPVAILAAGWMVRHWWSIPVFGAIAIGAVVARRWKVQPQEQPAPAVDAPTQQLTPFQYQQVQAPQEMWSAPQVDGNWDPRQG